ncbi:MAG: hydroxyacid dehydrogenase [Verrucomicrobia bacterium]|nr:MAG: hydroxyacid dehydrogenase [Verrucomicrobiota bacterium]
MVFLGVVLFLVSYTVYAERKVSAFIQDRIGPNRVGLPLTNLPFWGLGQPIADALKLLLKENFIPASANKFFYYIAPKLTMVPPILILAVLPFGSTLFGQKMVVADLNIGILYVFAISSLSVYGIVLAGWASNSKYPFLGGIRSSAQMISYELALGLSVIPIFLMMGSLSLPQIVEYQVKHGWTIAPWWPEGFSVHLLLQKNFHAVWDSFVDGFSLRKVVLGLLMSVSFLIFTVGMLAETNRLPFDLPEAEQELVGGYHTEYSSMGFALFFLGEYAAMIAGAGVIVTLFLGGWSLPFIPDGSQGMIWGIVNILTFFAKVAAILFLFIWIRWTLPRFRYDQLMKLGWYYLFEIALVNIFLTAFILAYWKQN